MFIAYQILLIVHVIAMGTWFAFPLSQSRRLRAALASTPENAKLFMQGITAERPILIASGMGTLLTGIALILVRGGFAAAQTRFHIALGLVIVMIAQGPLMFERIWSKVGEHIEAGKLDDAKPLTRKLAMASGIHHVLWLTVLVLMLWRG